MAGVLIRPAIKSDCGEIFRLIQELADFEKTPNAVQITLAKLEKDGFDSAPPLWKAFVAEVKEPDLLNRSGAPMMKLVGFALYNYAYAARKGLKMTLDHVYVTEKYRSLDIERNLYEVFIQTGVEMGCAQVDWFCLDSNPARSFYDRIGATNITEKEDWQIYRLNKDTMLEISSNSK